MKSLCAVFKVHISMREWLSGGVSPCQGEGRGFESRFPLRASLKEEVNRVKNLMYQRYVRFFRF